MPIVFHEKTKTFHLFNETFSYLIKILPEGFPSQLYYGAALPDRESYDYLFEKAARPMMVTWHEDDKTFSLEHTRMEYPSALSGDMREGAIELLQKNGSRITDFRYVGYEIESGKPKLENLPACYVENDDEAATLKLFLHDGLLGCDLTLSYTIYETRSVLCRNAKLENHGKESVSIERLMSLALDLPDADYERMVLAGAWARERNIEVSPLHTGSQSIYSLRGHSSHNYNPFLALKRKETTEEAGECIGFSLVYSGNFLAQCDVSTYSTTRVLIGMHPMTFSWPLAPGESFQSPEAVMVYSNQGLNDMSQTFHSLFQKRLARGVWRDKVRPILLNSWEGIYFHIEEQKVLNMVKSAKDLGIELFVLDDGWFLNRNDDKGALGDWVADPKKLPDGIGGLSRLVNDLGMEFGLWFEPEMISKNSNLFREHPEWMLSTPGRHTSCGRYQYVLDFSNPHVVDEIARQMEDILDHANVSYIKWDMNRSLSDVYSCHFPAEEQGTIYHRFILGVYALYERLIQRYPNILFESCASGGARFDPGMLYYAPQAWTSDDTDAIERLKIQYGTSMVYPISSMGAHVSAIPNHQLHRHTPLSTRGNVACFGTFGYELDPQLLSEEDREIIKEQVKFMKEYRHLIQFGTFYRLRSPFAGKETAWMVVSEDKKEAIVGYYRPLQEINTIFRRLHLQGLADDMEYTISGKDYTQSGKELARAGLVITDSSASENNDGSHEGDYLSRLYILKAKED